MSRIFFRHTRQGKGKTVGRHQPGKPSVLPARSPSLTLTIFAVVSLVLFGTAVAQGDVTGEEGNRPGNLAPDFELRRLSGEGNVWLEEFRGDVILLNFFAASCPSCLKDLPVFQEVHEEFEDQGVTVVGVGILDDYRTLSELVSDMGLTYPTGHDSSNDVARAYGLRGMPTTVFIDRNGIIREVRTRALSVEQIRRIVDPLL